MKQELVAGLIIRDGRILLVHNVKYHPVRIEPPGGKVHNGETREEAVAREVFEELGVKVKPGKIFGAFDTASQEGEFKVYMYHCEAVGGEPFLKEPEKIGAFGWYTVAEMKGFEKKGLLAPNMAEAMGELEGVLGF